MSFVLAAFGNCFLGHQLFLCWQLYWLFSFLTSLLHLTLSNIKASLLNTNMTEWEKEREWNRAKQMPFPSLLCIMAPVLLWCNQILFSSSHSQPLTSPQGLEFHSSVVFFKTCRFSSRSLLLCEYSYHVYSNDSKAKFVLAYDLSFGSELWLHVANRSL